MPHRTRHVRPALLAAVIASVILAVFFFPAGQVAVARSPDPVRTRLDALGRSASYRLDDAGRLVEVSIQDGAAVTAADLAALGGVASLRRLAVQNCRMLNDAMVESLTALSQLESLAITNSAISDAAVQAIATSFPNLVELDLSSNTNLTGAALKAIAGLGKLERLSLLQTGFNDLNTRRLSKLQNLRVLDLRGNMEAGDPTLELLGGLPRLVALKHRSTAVTDAGMEGLARSPTLESLLIQDFAITDASGRHLASMEKLSSLEIFRCQGIGSEGVLALGGLPLVRLTLRDLPDVGDQALAVLAKLPRLKRLYLHELSSVGDAGLRNLAAAGNLEVLDIWSMPRMTDAAIDVIAGLENLKELSIRETGVTEAAVARIAAMPKLQAFTFKNNGPLSAEQAAKLNARKWTKLDLGTAGGK